MCCMRVCAREFDPLPFCMMHLPLVEWEQYEKLHSEMHLCSEMDCGMAF